MICVTLPDLLLVFFGGCISGAALATIVVCLKVGKIAARSIMEIEAEEVKQ